MCGEQAAFYCRPDAFAHVDSRQTDSVTDDKRTAITDNIDIAA
jgi:hypothetical protein